MGDRDYVTSRDYEHPYRPFPIRLYNFLGREPAGSLDCRVT